MTISSIVAPKAWRQSAIARWDACPLSLKLGMESERTQPGELAAIGTLAHSWAEHALGYMRENGERMIPVEVGMELLQEIIAQRDVPDDEVVHVTARGLEHLRVVTTKFCWEHEYSIDRLVCVEQRFHTDIEVIGPRGTRYTRTITGKPDIVLAGPGAEECTVVDLKFGWAKPSKARVPTEEEEKDDRLSSKGIVQQLVYSLLLFDFFPVLQRIHMREFYVMWGESRRASYARWQMERIRDTVASIVSNMDAAVEADPALRVRQALARKEGKPIPQGRWIASGGTHCAMCPNPRHCPIREEVGIPTNYREAQMLVQEWHVAGEVRKERNPLVHGAYDAYGPIELPHSKGRKVVGYKEGSRALTVYEPEEAADSPWYERLEEAARDAGTLVKT